MVSKQIGDVIHIHTNINTYTHTHPITNTQTDKWTHGAHNSWEKNGLDQKSKLFIHFIRHFHLLTSYATQHYVYSPLWNWAFLAQVGLKKQFIQHFKLYNAFEAWSFPMSKTAQIHRESIQFCNAWKNTLFRPISAWNPSIPPFSQ